jgi:hypothetical protein
VFFTGVYETNAAVDDEGNAMIAWLGPSRNPDLEAAISARYRPPGGPWSPPEPLSHDVDAEEPPSLAFDAAGTAYAGWRYYHDDYELLARAFTAVRLRGGAFGPPAALVPGDRNVWTPDVAAGPAGRAIVVYNRGTFPYGFHAEAADYTTSTTSGPPATTQPPATSGTSATATAGSTGATDSTDPARGTRRRRSPPRGRRRAPSPPLPTRRFGGTGCVVACCACASSRRPPPVCASCSPSGVAPWPRPPAAFAPASRSRSASSSTARSGARCGSGPPRSAEFSPRPTIGGRLLSCAGAKD